MESFGAVDTNFDFSKLQTFSDDDFRQFTQFGMVSGTGSPLQQAASQETFDFNAFLGNEVNGSAQTPVSMSDHDQALPSVEPANATTTPPGAPPADTASTGSPNKAEEQHTIPASISNGGDQILVSSSMDFSALTGLKDDSVDPVLYAFGDDLFTEPEQLLPLPDPFPPLAEQMSSAPAGNNSMPSLGSPFHPMPNIRTDIDPGFASHPGPPQAHPHQMPPSGQMPHIVHPNAIPGHMIHPGRRRSNTAPPDCEAPPEFQVPSFARRMPNGSHQPINHGQSPQLGPHGRPLGPYPMPDAMARQLNPHNPHRGPHLMGPRSFPVTPPQRPHPNFGAQRPNGYPRSLDPETRSLISQQYREPSPERTRGRPMKRQKTSMSNGPPMMLLPAQLPHVEGVGCGAFGINETMGAVEFLLRDTTAKATFGKDEGLEKARSEARVLNCVVSSLDTTLAEMVAAKAPPFALPRTGGDIRELNTQSIQAILDFYDIPFVSTMFLHDKKLLYLQFLGVSKMLKHLVLD